MPYVEVNPSEIQAPMGGFIPISEEEARKAKKPPSSLAPAYETTKSIATVWGPLEVGAELVSGIPGFIAGGITSGAEAVSGKKIPYADKLVEFLESPSITYRPKTASGQQLESALANIFITARETGQNVADVTLEKTGSPLLSTILGTSVGGIPEILMAIAGIKKGLRPKAKAPGYVTAEEWAELKPKPEQIEFKPRVEVPAELQRPALPPGQGFILLDKKPETILRSKPPKGKEVLISETGEPITPENVIPQELKTKALPPSQGFIMLDEKPATILRQPPPPSGKARAPVITKEGETIGVKPEAKVEALKSTEPLPVGKVLPEAPPVKDMGKQPSSYKQFIESGGKPDEWEAYRIEQNRKFAIARNAEFIQKWKSGEEIPGNDISNFLRSKEIDIPESLKKTLQHDDTTVSTTSASGRGMNRSEASKVHKFVSEAMRKEDIEPSPEIMAPAKGGEVVKQPWEMTKVEWLTQPHHPRDARFIGDQFHHDYVKEALATGKPVPPEVLKEYPGLADMVKEIPKSIPEELKIEGISLKPTGKTINIGGVKNPVYEKEYIAAYKGKKFETHGENATEAMAAARLRFLGEDYPTAKSKISDILKSETGAIQIPTVEEIKRLTNRFKEFWSPFSTLAQRESLLKIRGEALGGMARTERIVDRAINLTKGLSDQAKKDIFEAIDMSRKDIDTLPPEQAHIAKEFITTNNIIGKMLVERGLIGEETYRNLKGQYIKYAYLKHSLGEGVEIPINPNGKINTNALKARKGLTLEQQKAIGFIEDVSIAQPLGMAQSLSNIVKYDYLEKLASDPRNVWEPSIINIADMPRKYSESIGKAQATRLSRATGDPHRAVQVGNDWQIMNLQNREFVGKKMGIGELYEEVELYKKMVKANPNSPEIKQRLGVYEKYLKDAEQATKNAPKDFIQMPTAKSWGPLAGTFLRKEVARDLMSFYGKERGNIQGLTKAIDVLADIDLKATGLFKIGKVPLNLPTVVRNTISNPIQLNLSGMNFADIIKNMVRTGEDFIKKPPTYTKAFRAGLFKTNWSVTEINEVMNQFRHLKGDTFADVVGAVKGLSKYYGRVDDFFKYTKLLDGLDNGLPFEKAIIESQKWVMDYSLADPSIKWARKRFIPFASYSYKIAPLVAESTIKRPWVLAKYMALPPAIMALTKELYKDEMTEDDWKGLKKTIPQEVQRRQSFLIVPWKIKDKWYWFDYSYFLPWGNYMNAISGIAGGDIKAPLVQFGIGGTPLLTALKTFTFSAMRDEPPKDSFSGQPVFNRIDEPIDKALKVSEYFYNLFAPSMVTRYGALGETLDIGKEDRYGRIVPAEQAIGKWFGVNLKEADPRLAAIVKKSKINALKDEYMRIMIDPKFSTEKKEKYAQRFQEEIKQIIGGD